MIKVSAKGDFKKLNNFFQKALQIANLSELDKYGKRGVEALRSMTPKDSGETAASWGYKIERKKNSLSIYWYNTNINDGANIAILLQYGHGTGNGGYVNGIDYINPAIKPIFEEIAAEVERKVKEL